MHYIVVFEEGSENWSAYVPDVPGCVSTGRTRAECEAGIREALLLHLGSMLADGEPLPPAGLYAAEIEIDSASLREEAARLAHHAAAD
jgi:predicted RNase H-like HicB family nuclease